MNDEKTLFCPFLDAPCREERCALYVSQKETDGKCTFAVIPEKLEDIYRGIDSIDDSICKYS